MREQIHDIIWKWWRKALLQQKKNWQGCQTLLRVKQQLLHKVKRLLLNILRRIWKKKNLYVLFVKIQMKNIWFYVLNVKYGNIINEHFYQFLNIYVYIYPKKHTCKNSVTLHKDLEPHCFDHNHVTQHKKWSFSLRISSLNVTKSAVTTDLVTFTE